MKILLVHPDDCLTSGVETKTVWNRVVDLGWSGRHFYAGLSERLGCPVLSIYDLLDHARHRQQLRELLGVGLGQLVDSESIDWWDLFSGPLYQRLELVMLASVLAEQISEGAEIFATRPHFVTNALSLLLRGNVQILPTESEGRVSDTGALRLLKKAFRCFSPSQIADVVFDKWDADYRLRRLVGSRRRSG
jgi:hypothetical protein